MPTTKSATADEHPLISDLRKRFAADIIRREPIDRGTWLARLNRETGQPGPDGDDV